MSLLWVSIKSQLKGMEKNTLSNLKSKNMVSKAMSHWLVNKTMSHWLTQSVTLQPCLFGGDSATWLAA